ncbi:unnamed protein product [Jaminaea pallidilutea]
MQCYSITKNFRTFLAKGMTVSRLAWLVCAAAASLASAFDAADAAQEQRLKRIASFTGTDYYFASIAVSLSLFVKLGLAD